MSRWDYDSILRQWVCPRKKHQSSIFSMKKLGQTYWVCCSQLKGPTDFRRDRLWVTQLLELWPLMVGTFSFLSPRMMVGSHYYKSVPLPCKSMLYVKLTGNKLYWIISTGLGTGTQSFHLFFCPLSFWQVKGKFCDGGSRVGQGNMHPTYSAWSNRSHTLAGNKVWATVDCLNLVTKSKTQRQWAWQGMKPKIMEKSQILTHKAGRLGWWGQVWVCRTS